MDNALKSWSTTLLVNTNRENTVDKVVLPNSEFTAEENEIYMSNTMKNALDANHYDEIFIRMVELPKCQEVKLKAMSANISKISNIKALLESYFRKEQTLLYIGQEINVVDWQETYKFIVQELKPEMACIVIDTDVEVDIEPFEGDNQGFELNNNNNNNNSNKGEIIELPITLKSKSNSTSNKINYTSGYNGMIKNFTIDKEEYYYYKVKIPLHSYISIQLIIRQGDVNLYYSFNIEKPDAHNCIGYNVDLTKQRKIVISTEKNIDNFIYFSIQGYQDKNEFDISVQEVDKDELEIDNEETTVKYLYIYIYLY
ncbi:ubiquitin fusion degradation protein UFD1-domain-containing protein [Neocallimastix lanati (nom. inval.)]|nr:ubiquitin fusion degradation protein UFD1-domain-containing protein [Neocallimastix sp. JGI-2020a]